METKVCRICKETLPKDMFYYGRCKPCHRKISREKYAIRKLNTEWREARNARHREYKRLNPRTNAMRRKEWLKD